MAVQAWECEFRFKHLRKNSGVATCACNSSTLQDWDRILGLIGQLFYLKNNEFMVQ